MNWLGAHAALVLGGFGGAFVLGLAVRFLPGVIGRQLALALDDVVDHLNLPEDKAAFKAILAAIDVRFPNHGDAKYSMMVDDIIKKVPQLAASRQPLVDLLTGIGDAVKNDLDARK